MFSYMTQLMRSARPMAAVPVCCVLISCASAQVVTAPIPPTAPMQTPGAPAPGPMQMPGGFQPPGTPQAPVGLPAPAAPQRGVTVDLSVPSDAQPASTELVHHIQSPSERMELTVNSSRILTLDQNIPRAQVNNREILELTALSPNEIQVLAKKAGVTQINLWNEKGQIYTIDCVVYGDARELAELLRTEFPAANLHVRPMASSVLLTGFVDRADQVSQIIQIAQDYYPKVVPNIQVGGVQQILLHVKVAEVSRSKMRQLGIDFASINGSSFVASSISGLLNPASVAGLAIPGASGDTVRFGVVDGSTAFFGFIEALRKDNILKILSDPTLVTVSGRPAFFNSGGEFPILVPQSLGTVSIEYKKFGTQVDFVPIVLGNGNVRLEVRPRISEIDPTRSITINGTTVPGLRVREADTGVEMKPGQTLAIAGLVQTRLETQKQEIPWLGDLPYIGALFRNTFQTEEEIESLIMVTPEVVQALDPCDVPRCYPGMHSDVPNDCQLYLKGYNEVPSQGPCGPYGCTPQCGVGDSREGPGYGPEGSPMLGPMPGGVQPAEMYESAPPVPQAAPTPARPTSAENPPMPSALPSADNRYNPSPGQDPRSANGTNRSGNAPGFIGPVGYDVLN